MALGEFKENILDMTTQREFDASNSRRLPNAFNLSSSFGQNEALLGLDSGNSESLQSRGKALSKHNEDVRRRAERGRKSADDVMLLDMLQQAREASDRMARDIAEMESGFAAKYGDAWREEMANEVLEPDMIPERREDESVAEYRERVEQVLIDEIIDPATGKAKSKYQDDPRYADRARWAETQFKHKKLDGWIERRSDPNLTEEEGQAMDQELVKDGDFQDLATVKAEMSTGPQGETAISDEIDNKIDVAVAKSSDANAFLA